MQILAFTLLCFTYVLSSDVLIFENSNFTKELAKHDLILVEYYAPWFEAFGYLMLCRMRLILCKHISFKIIIICLGALIARNWNLNMKKRLRS